MKKISIFIIIYISILFNISCTKDDDVATSSSFNPPNWILGTWQDKNEPEWSQIGGFKFTKNSIIDLDINGSEIINYSESLKTGLNSGIINIEEITTSNSYQVKVITSGVSSLNYNFNKGSENTIFYELNSTYSVVLTKQ